MSAGEAASAGIEVPAEVRGPAEVIFGERLADAQAYAQLLSTDGVLRGLIGPREAPRIWQRHLLNCAVVADLIPSDASLVDVGAGAGLPGIVLAIVRPDLSVTLVEPMARRTSFLTEAVVALRLAERVTVLRARADECVDQLAPADVVAARALAPLDRLAGWCLPLAAVGGRVLAVKGATAADEITAHTSTIRRLGGGMPTLRQCGGGLIEPPTTVVEFVRERRVRPKGGRRDG